jgi:hypothetical protein
MTNAFLARFARAADAAFTRAGLADTATYKQTPQSETVPCVVMIDRDVQQVGTETETADKLTTLRVSSASVLRPVNGSTFIVGAETFVVESLEASDEAYHVCIVWVQP